MKKSIISIALVLCVLLGVVSPVAVQAKEHETYMVPDYQMYQNFMTDTYPVLFRDRLYLATLDASSGYQNYFDIASMIIGEDLSVERCIQILANMATLMNYQLEESIVEQATMDTTMTLYDYGVDLADIAAGVVGTDTFKKAADSVMKGIATTMGVANGVLDVAVDTKEELELLVQLEGDFSMQYDFLETVYMYADIPEMKEAAQTLMLANEQIMLHKLEVFNSTTSATAKFAAHDVFLDQVAEELLKDPDFFDSDAWLAVKALSTAYSLYSGAKLAFDITIFLGDVMFGAHDIYNRYNEMVAMRDIRQALLNRVEANPALNEEDYDNMDRNISLMKMSLYIDAHGEYCVHQMITEDGKLAKLIFTTNQNSIEDKYNASVRLIENTFENLELLYCVKEWDSTGVIDSNIPADAKKITLSRDEQYRINIFLSNFAEQSFCEYWDCEKFETQSASIGELISFVFWHSWANNETKLRSRQDSSGKIYLTIDEINKDVERFFDRTVTLDDAISSGYHVEGDCVYGHFGSYGPYNYMSVADAMWQRADGTCIVDFSVYQVNDRYDVGSGLIGDKGVYYLTSEEAAADTGVLYYKSGVAEVKPHLNNGKDSYQLISYQLKPNGKSVVSDAYCDVLQIDDFLKPFSCYHIPKVTIPGVNTTTANTEIFNELHSEMRENVYDDPSNPVYTSMTYMWSESKHVVSVRVLISHSYTDWIADYTYNFSKETGALLSNQELLNILGITEKRYLELLETAVKKEIFDFCQQFQSHSPANDEIEWILAENRETCSIDATSLCVDANGNLGCMVNIPWTNCNMRMVAATGDGMLYFPNVSCNQKGKHTIVIPTIQEDHSTDTSTSDKDAVANEDDEAEKLPYSSLTGAFEFNGHYYKVFLDSSISWHAAKAKCEQMGGYLVCISDEQEDAFVFSLAQQSRVQCWMGGSDEEEEGVWKWVTGEEWIYDNGFYDNRNGKQHYLVMNYSGMNTWDDQSEIDDSFLCQVSGYICEWDKK